MRARRFVDRPWKIAAAEIVKVSLDAGGVLSGEHGIGRAKKSYYLELEDPTKVALMRRIKQAFDPHGILGPGVLFDS